jgi:lipoprotein-anchoring transpeptidase ErfK/SrfK
MVEDTDHQGLDPLLGPRLSRRRIILAASTLALARFVGAGVDVARADRFGPPWMARVVGYNVLVFQQADRRSPVAHVLNNGSFVVVLGETTASDGAKWTQLPEGYVTSDQIKEETTPWVAEVTAPSVSVYALPDAADAIRRTAKQGDLLRVTGVSAGVDADHNTWWATTEGYVHLGTIQPSRGTWAQQWTLPAAAEALHGWWGQVSSDANVRAGATTQAPIVGGLNAGAHMKVLASQAGEFVQGSSTWHKIDGGRYAGAWVHGSLIDRIADPPANTKAPDATPPNGTWIVVDRAPSTLTLVKNGQAQLVTYVSLGKAATQTPDGVSATVAKYRFDRMTSRSVPDATHAYDLPNVPFTEYFRGDGSAIHGTYWHDNFGNAQSQGCINLTWADSAYLFDQTFPAVPPDQPGVQVDGAQATPVLIVN